MKIIVDTSLLIDFTRKARIKKEEILWLKLVKFAKEEGHQLLFPTVALFEFFSGDEMENPVNEEKANNILKDLIILDVTPDMAKTAARLFRKFQLNIGLVDYLLAATTILFEGEVVTLNPKHFKSIKNLRLFDLSKLR